MFGLFKKKENKENIAEEPKQDTQPKGFGFAKKKFIPTFGKVEDFARAYADGEKPLIIGTANGISVSVDANDAPTNNIVILNDDNISIAQQCVIPIVRQGTLSYVVYDPSGSYHSALAPILRSKGYDVQLVDLSDEENQSRIDLFEIANITKNAYWTSLILSGSIKCEGAEVAVAKHLFMTLMQYLLDTSGKITIENMKDLFTSLRAKDQDVIQQITNTKSANQYWVQFMNADPATRIAVYKKMSVRFFKAIENKVKNPNIFTVAMPKKQTALFIKEIPPQYKYLITTMLFNLKAASVVCGDGSTNTLIVDSANDKWYNRKLLDRVCSESGNAMSRGVASIYIRDVLYADSFMDTHNGQLWIYMHSNDDATKASVYNNLTVRTQLSQDERVALSKQFFNGKKIPEDILNSAPINREELDNLNDCIIIDTCHKVRPIRCDRLS